MHSHIQNSIPLAVLNATMHILQPNTTYISEAMSNSVQLSTSAIAVALPYSDTTSNQKFSALLTRHPQYSTAVNVCFLLLVLTWAFWERIMEGVEAFDNWLVEETMKEDQREWREGYRRARRNLRPVGILKKGESGVLDGEREESQTGIGRRRKNRVCFAQDVKDFDGERGGGCWDLEESCMERQEVDSLICHLCSVA